MELLIELELNMGLAKGQKRKPDYLGKQKLGRRAWTLQVKHTPVLCENLQQVISLFSFEFSILERYVRIVS